MILNIGTTTHAAMQEVDTGDIETLSVNQLKQLIKDQIRGIYQTLSLDQIALVFSGRLVEEDTDILRFVREHNESTFYAIPRRPRTETEVDLSDSKIPEMMK